VKGPLPAAAAATAPQIAVGGVRLLSLPVIEDLRGKLSFGEAASHLPFTPRRYFVVFDVPSKEVRGEHAHRKLQQTLVCLRGSLDVMVDDGSSRAVVTLAGPQQGLFVPPMVWTSHYRYSPDAMLLVLASDAYDPGDYIRDYDEFMGLQKRS
jgi:dTDP-4-dehydrorhamnose 3,5-epimerase-like enzyme